MTPLICTILGSWWVEYAGIEDNKQHNTLLYRPTSAFICNGSGNIYQGPVYMAVLGPHIGATGDRVVVDILEAECTLVDIIQSVPNGRDIYPSNRWFCNANKVRTYAKGE